MAHHPDIRAAFDPAALFAALDAKRATEGISWREVARRAGMPGTNGFAGKLRGGSHPSAGVLVLLLAWLGETDLAPYIRREGEAGQHRRPPSGDQPTTTTERPPRHHRPARASRPS